MTQNTEKQRFFSIITVTLNNLEGLKRTHESLNLQIFRDFEWIVIDGNSGQDTTAYLKSTPANWTSESDNGIYDAMNKGIARANGQYILFLNAGDTLAAPETLETIKTATTDNPDFIYGDALEDGAYKPARSHKDIAAGMFTHHQSMLYRHNALENLKYDCAYKIAAGFENTYGRGAV